mmetsp:Transcript_7270/g.18146  ORF Transcript_7270/g.18146 Transcript_7270/m.18146 type:complete len:201 (-) Transcript_7270:889-1491(-)
MVLACKKRTVSLLAASATSGSSSMLGCSWANFSASANSSWSNLSDSSQVCLFTWTHSSSVMPISLRAYWSGISSLRDMGARVNLTTAGTGTSARLPSSFFVRASYSRPTGKTFLVRSKPGSVSRIASGLSNRFLFCLCRAGSQAILCRTASLIFHFLCWSQISDLIFLSCFRTPCSSLSSGRWHHALWRCLSDTMHSSLQ